LQFVDIKTKWNNQREWRQGLVYSLGKIIKNVYI